MQPNILQRATDEEIASFRLVMTINMLGHVLGRTLPLEFTTQDCIDVVELAIDKLMEPAQPAPDAGEEEER